MELEKLFAVVIVMAIGITGVLTFINYHNASYGTTAGVSFNDTLNKVDLIDNASSITIGSANNIPGNTNGGATNTISNLAQRALSIITVPFQLIGLIPSMIQNAGVLLGIPPIYASAAVYSFYFSFSMLIAYLLIIGFRRFFT